jgi:myosin-5
MGALDGGSAVYVPHEEAGWVAATVLSSLGEGKFEVKLLAVEDGEGRKDEAAGQVAIYETKHAAFEGMDLGGGLPLQNIDTSEEGVADMTRLNHLHEPAILFNLRQRFLVKGFPYTYTGDIVIALNPYRWLDLYSPSIAARYAGMQHGQRSSEPPHVFSTSAIAFHGLKSTGRNQSILVSGESGAGKTETVKILLSHLASMAKGVGGTVNMEESSVMRTIIQSNPLLESFGNAKTVRNDNSSRFGKFTRLQFSEQGDMACAMVGSLCTTYLLEKSRVVGHSAGERNYHIFYQMCAAGEERKAKWGLAGLQARDFDYLTADGREADAVIEGKTDGARFDITCEALGLLGLSASDLDELFSALAGVMFLGQVKFENSDDEESSRVAGPVTSLEAPAKLLRLDSVSDLEGAMTHRTVRARREVIRTPNRADAAASTRDSMAKAIYSAAFDWLVSHINSSTSRGTGGKTINLLDIFGFESFTVNRFEQLCINYANEKLQQKFTQDVFKTVQLEYEDEGVPWEHVSFPDNSEVLWLIESTTGVLSILDEECIIPRGSDERFASKLGSIHEGHPAFVKNKLVSPTFALKHYAGMVTYQAEGFLDKNRDAVGEAVVNLLRESESQLLANAFRSSAFPSSPSSSRGGSSRSTLASTFKANLADLITSVNSTSVQYVRCIKPNSTKSPGAIENMKVLEQLRCAGVIEAIRISRAAYPNRLLHSQFFARFMVLHRECTDSMSLREALVESGNMPESGFQWGRTRVYFKSGALESLEEMRLVCRQTAALLLQANVRMWISAAQFRKKRTATILLQANWRRVAAFARFATAKRRIVILQAKWRAIQARAVVVALCANTAASKVCRSKRVVFYYGSFLPLCR